MELLDVRFVVVNISAGVPRPGVAMSQPNWRSSLTTFTHWVSYLSFVLKTHQCSVSCKVLHNPPRWQWVTHKFLSLEYLDKGKWRRWAVLCCCLTMSCNVPRWFIHSYFVNCRAYSHGQSWDCSGNCFRIWKEGDLIYLAISQLKENDMLLKFEYNL